MATEGATPVPDAKPLVARPVSNAPVWIFVGILAIAGIGLFSALEARRADLAGPATTVPVGLEGRTITAPPPLVLPDLTYDPGGPGDESALTQAPLVPSPVVPAGLYPPPRAPRQQLWTAPAPPPVVPPVYVGGGALPAPFAGTTPNQAELTASPRAEVEQGPEGAGTGGRARATRLANPANTVPQGAIIQAVLETALDSNRPGLARAIVSRDVRSFDGTRVLIPRGSRLFGEYQSDFGQGQKRALITWQKLTRPDGVQIAINSPSADQLGRAGVGGKVNTHFFERFSGAILQSVLDVGVAVASRKAAGDTVVIGLPGSSQTVINPETQSMKPTLRIRNGTGVSVFVARDLDFSGMD
jgi:type IV secretion system protein VirB10